MAVAVVATGREMVEMVEGALMLRRVRGAEGHCEDDLGHSEVPVCG